MLDRPRHPLMQVLVRGAMLALVAGTPASAQEPDEAAPALELPARVPLEVSSDALEGLDRYQLGSCCYVPSLTEEPPASLENVPPPEGKNRRFHVLELGQSKIILSFEDLEEEPSPGSRIRVRADLNQNLDLTDDPFLACRRDQLCGPIWTDVRHAQGTARYSLTLRYFGAGRGDVLWYWRSAALVGTVAGRKIVIIDDDSNGTYDDPADLLVVDLDGDGELDGGPDGRESMLRHNPIPWGGIFLSVADIDPVASVLTLERAQEVESIHTVTDSQSGSPIAGARVTFHPGSFSAISDSRGKAVLRRPAARPDFVTVVANGYWGKVHGPGQQSGESGETILLDPGPCRGEGVRWCGRETLETSSLTSCRIDLDSGVVGPRAGSAPGPWDLGWFAPGRGMTLVAEGGAGLVVLDGADYDALGHQQLHRLSFDQTEVLASEDCNEGPIRGPVAAEGRLHRGTVLGVRTQEGRLGKIRLETCGWDLALSWVVYEGTAASQP